MAETSPVYTEAELAKLPEKKVINLVMTHASEEFAELWEMQDEGGDMMHPDEDEDEFYEHEDPDKD